MGILYVSSASWGREEEGGREIDRSYRGDECFTLLTFFGGGPSTIIKSGKVGQTNIGITSAVYSQKYHVW